MSTPAPAPVEPKKLDPVVERIVQSFGGMKVSTEPVSEESITALPDGVSPGGAGLTLGQIAAMQAEKKTTPPPAPTPPATTEPAPAAAPVEVVPSTVDRIERKIESIISRQPPTPAAPTPAPAAQPPQAKDDEPVLTDEDKRYMDTLTDRQFDEIQLAIQASASMPDKYKAFPKQRLDYYRALDKWMQENPDFTESELKDFDKKNAPKWQTGDRRKAEIDMVAEKAREKLVKPIEDELQRTRRELFEIKTKPVVEAKVEEFSSKTLAQSKVGDFVMPKEAIEAVRTKPLAQAIEEHPIEARAIAQALALSHEFVHLRNGMKNLDANNPVHVELLGFIAEKSQTYPADKRARDGKSYVPYLQFLNLPADQQKNHFTLGDDEILSMIADNATQNVAKEHDRLVKAYGFKREVKVHPSESQNSSQNPAPSPTPAPNTSPAFTPSPVMSGRSAPGAGVNTPQMPNADVFRSLGLPVPTAK